MLEKKYKILFVCLGNICRSPAAEGIMKDLIKRSKLEYLIEVDSAGTYGGHAGDLPDSRMRAHALRRGYNLTHRSRQIRVDDFDEYDMIIAMDDMNVNKLRRLAPDVASIQKIYLMTDYCTRLQVDHVPDPYYSGSDGFEQVLDILEDACAGLLKKLINN
ncbi:putative uncharacterized protein [Tannerella sp. CAG:118]|nr:putative uncharacterized protein [Tannerella sp. CAG:118]